jgi:hypothetical protein
MEESIMDSGNLPTSIAIILSGVIAGLFIFTGLLIAAIIIGAF